MRLSGNRWRATTLCWLLLGACSTDDGAVPGVVTGDAEGNPDAPNPTGGDPTDPGSGDGPTEMGGSDGDAGPVDQPPVPVELPYDLADFTVLPGVETVSVIGAEAGEPLTLYDAAGTRLLTMLADEQGQAHFAYVPTEYLEFDTRGGVKLTLSDGGTLKPGDGYTIRNDSLDPVEGSERFRVLAVEDTPDEALYEGQSLQGVATALIGEAPDMAPGFQYIEVRDGVTLSVMVRFPDPLLYGNGPYPTVVEYSGYSPSRPDRSEPGSRIANLLGYATVGVNMRGTGCSGGVFDIFNPAQHADGYDVIETIARQQWVLNGKVGMVGLSYSGISQLYVAATRPPSLAAITPQSTVGDLWQQQWPGGVYNAGFTKQWLAQRDSQAEAGGMSWSVQRIEDGDETCRANQSLRAQNIDFEAFLRALDTYPDDAADRSLPLLIGDIDVPVYHTGAFQDEQTGAQFAGMVDRYTTDTLKVVLYNGRHPDGYSPLVLTRWFEFLELFVAERVPRLNPLVRGAAGPMLSDEYGVEGLSFEPDRFADFRDDDYLGVLSAWGEEPTVRVIFENGAGGDDPGAPLGRFEAGFETWPPSAAVGQTFYLGTGGTLSTTMPSAGAERYEHDPGAATATFFGPRGYQLMAPLWDIDWSYFPEGKLLSYVTEAFSEDTVFAGPGYAELYVKSEVAEVDMQVTLSEIWPDGTESLIQNGWLRLGHRKVDAERSDEFRVEHTFKSVDYAPMPLDSYERVQVPIPSFGQAVRAGSRLRVTISAPGRNHGLWEFEEPEYDDVPVHTVGYGAQRPSHVYLPTVSGVDVAAGLPACPSLRGQPCRTFVQTTNTSAN